MKLQHGWQAMEFAPKDGTEILAFDPVWGRCVAYMDEGRLHSMQGIIHPTMWHELPGVLQ